MVPLFWQQSGAAQRWFRWPLDIAIDPDRPQAEETVPVPSAEAAILCQLKPALALPLRRGLAGTQDHSPLLEPVYRPLTHILDTLKLSPLELGQSEESEALESGALESGALSWGCSGLGLDTAQFRAAIDGLFGVGVSYPSGWSSQYQTNIQNAILGTGLVSDLSAIHFVEETTAAALACLQPTGGPAIGPLDRSTGSLMHKITPEGLAFVVSAGASTTELALVDLSAIAQDYRAAAQSRTFAYGGRALDQDILYYILYPQLQASPLAEVERLLDALGLDTLDKPQLGQPDSARRRRLHLRLCGSAPGRQMLAIAQVVKHELQTKPRVTYTLAQHRGQVTQSELGHQILLPYVQALNQQAQALVRASGGGSPAVQQVICSGGTASMRVVAHWARRCFPEAALRLSTSVAAIRAETGLETAAKTSEGENLSPASFEPEVPPESPLWLGSQVSYGLASLPLHSGVAPNSELR